MIFFRKSNLIGFESRIKPIDRYQVGHFPISTCRVIPILAPAWAWFSTLGSIRKLKFWNNYCVLEIMECSITISGSNSIYPIYSLMVTYEKIFFASLQCRYGNRNFEKSFQFWKKWNTPFKSVDNVLLHHISSSWHSRPIASFAAWQHHWVLSMWGCVSWMQGPRGSNRCHSGVPVNLFSRSATGLH